MNEFSTLLAILGVLVGSIGGYCVSLKMHPKNKNMREMEKFWEEECSTLRKEVRRMKSALTNAKRGQIAYGALEADTDDQFLDGIMEILPDNLKFLKQFKGAIKPYLAEHPELKDTVKDFIKQKAGAALNKDAPENKAEVEGI